MKKIALFLLLLLMTGCVVAGEFPPERNRLHNMNRTEACALDETRCIKGTDIPW